MDASSAPSVRREIRDGIRDILPPAIAGIPIGLLFGALAVGKDLTVPEVMLMSASIFAGGAQFAALDLWAKPLPAFALIFSTLLINSRHVLMGASLTPKTGRFRPWQRFLGFSAMADENWAFAERRAMHRPLTFAYFGAMGAVFWLNWLVWSTLGAIGGSFLGDPKRIGADFAFTALFIGLIVSFAGRRPANVAIIASALTAAATFVLVGSPWHVAAGAIAGIAAAYVAAPATRPPQDTLVSDAPLP